MAAINLISDTFTKPTPAMLDAMMSAPVGDDVFREDPSINSLEAYSAILFGLEAALFCPSGTMTNQLAIKGHTQPTDEVICHEKSHIYTSEGGGYAYHSGVAIHLLQGDYGIVHPKDVSAAIKPNYDWLPKSKLVVLENTCNFGGGSIYPMSTLEEIAQITKAHRLKLHLDGARLFNALVETGERPEQFGQLFDSISICLSKGLGAPVGSLLIGNQDFIDQARRMRKIMGGGMRQAGYLAAAGEYALKHHVNRLKEDHQKAQLLSKALRQIPKVEEIYPCPTNILIFTIDPTLLAQDVVRTLKDNDLLCAAFGPNHIRLVTHLDVSFEDIAQACDILEKVLG